jgi:hypothetical protein
MKKAWMIIITLVITLSACLPGQESTPVRPATGGSCGDGGCSGPENASNCPADCLSAPVNSNTGTLTFDTSASHAGGAPLYITTMTHMEGNFTDDLNQSVFTMHVQQLTYGMNMADEYGALLTIESEKPFAIANDRWGRNFMQEIVERGHGAGTHCDIGYNEPHMSVADFEAMFTENKSLVDTLIGAGNNLGCSGGGSVNDWALAASQAGFKYLDGIVAMHYLSMPIENRPSLVWTDDFIRNGHFHLNAPVNLFDRIYPFEVADAQDFQPDPNPVILVSSGELGLISAVAERGREYEDGGPILHDDEYAFDESDVDAIVQTILVVDASRDRSRIAKLSVYIPCNYFDPQNELVLRYFFEQMQTLASQGVITWATQKQVYEAYMDWKN